jgi:DNA-binding XRE family transcriptional regulator
MKKPLGSKAAPAGRARQALNLKGEELIVMTKAELAELLKDAADTAIYDDAVASGDAEPGLPSDLMLAVCDGSMHPLTAWRKAAGLTQGQLAERCGLRSATISDFEKGKNDPRLSTLRALAEGLGLEVGDIIPD